MRAIPQPIRRRRRQVVKCNRSGSMEAHDDAVYVVNIGIPMAVFDYDDMMQQRAIAESMNGTYNGTMVVSGISYMQFIMDTHMQLLAIERLVWQYVPTSCMQSFRTMIL